MSLLIRPAVREDVPVILRFVRELAEYEREPHAVVATEALIEAALFADGHVAHGLIAMAEGAVVGYSIYFFNYSTWLGRRGLYLEDLYVTTTARGSGVGRAMLTRLAQIAVEKDCGRMEWSVLDWNAPAVNFYLSVGARALDQWTGYRLEGKSLEDFARSAT